MLYNKFYFCLFKWFFFKDKVIYKYIYIYIGNLQLVYNENLFQSNDTTKQMILKYQQFVCSFCIYDVISIRFWFHIITQILCTTRKTRNDQSLVSDEETYLFPGKTQVFPKTDTALSL